MMAVQLLFVLLRHATYLCPTGVYNVAGTRLDGHWLWYKVYLDRYFVFNKSFGVCNKTRL